MKVMGHRKWSEIKRHLTISEAALQLGLAPATLRAQIRNGRLEATKVGPIFLVQRSELERYRRDSLGKVGRPDGARDSKPRSRSRQSAPTEPTTDG
jgi:excisionase family DNA binding protein